jgi:hypothetical protein
VLFGRVQEIAARTTHATPFPKVVEGDYLAAFRPTIFEGIGRDANKGANNTMSATLVGTAIAAARGNFA